MTMHLHGYDGSFDPLNVEPMFDWSKNGLYKGLASFREKQVQPDADLSRSRRVGVGLDINEHVFLKPFIRWEPRCSKKMKTSSFSIFVSHVMNWIRKDFLFHVPSHVG